MGNFRGKSTHVNMKKLIEVIEMIGYVIALIVLAVFALYLFVDGVWTHDELDIVKTDIDELYKGFNDYRARCDAHKELIEALSKSVRELNGVVEAAVKVKEETSDNKPDAKALIGGWIEDDGQARIDTSHISTKTIMMWHGRFVNECGRLADGTVVWGDKDGRLYVGDAKPYEMDQ